MDLTSLATELVAVLKEKHITISSCESFTAGLFCSTIADVPGASAVLKGGVVSYATEIKESVVHVDSDVIRTYGVISHECAIEMAKQAKVLLKSDLCVSFTGNAGPDAWEGKPAGCIYCAIAYQGDIKGYDLQVDLPRNELRQYAVAFILKEVYDIVTNSKGVEEYERKENGSC